jgi:hypothetical protein
MGTICNWIAYTHFFCSVLFIKCNAEVERLLALVTKRKSMWTNAKQQLAGKMQQNMEVNVQVLCVLPYNAHFE